MKPNDAAPPELMKCMIMCQYGSVNDWKRSKLGYFKFISITPLEPRTPKRPNSAGVLYTCTDLTS